MKLYLLVSSFLVFAVSNCFKNFSTVTLPDTMTEDLMRSIIKTVYVEKFGGNMTCDDCHKKELALTEFLTGLFADWKPIMGEVCAILGNKTTLTKDGCDTLMANFVPIVQSSFTKLFILHNGLLCHFMLQVCPNGTIQRYDLDTVMNQIYQGQPPKKEKFPTYRQSYKILQMNDIHIDFNYLTGGIVNCKEGIMCCRANKTVLDGQEPVYAGPWGSLGGNCDIPEPLLDQLVSFIRTNIKPDMVFWLGDNENHEVDTITRDVNLNTTGVIANKLGLIAQDGARFVVSIGNHENNPIDNMDFNNATANAWFFQNLTKDYAPLINKTEMSSINKTGYYSSYFPEKNLRIISLYSAPTDSLNFYLLVRTYDPDGQLAWLWNELKAAEAANQDVFITIHIPIGNDFSIGLWDKVFNALIDRYQNNIRAIFSAHTHNDHLIFHRPRSNLEEVIKTQYVAPSVTTFSNLRPSFRVFEIDSDTNEVIDYTQYRLDLDKWNKAGENATLEWDIAYTFRNEYKVNNMSAEAMQTIYDLMKNDYTEMGNYISNFNDTVYDPSTDVSPYSAVKLRCMMYSNSADVFRCLGLLAPVVASDMFATLLLGNIFPAFMYFGKS